jgi:hypothetical protein
VPIQIQGILIAQMAARWPTICQSGVSNLSSGDQDGHAHISWKTFPYFKLHFKTKVVNFTQKNNQVATMEKELVSIEASFFRLLFYF